MPENNVCVEIGFDCEVERCTTRATHNGPYGAIYCCKHFDCSALRKARERERVKGRGRSVMYGAAKDLAWLIEMIGHQEYEGSHAATPKQRDKAKADLDSAVRDWVEDRVPKIVDALWGAAGGTGVCDGGYEPTIEDCPEGGDGPDD